MTTTYTDPRGTHASQIQRALDLGVQRSRHQALFWLLLMIAGFQAVFASMPWIDLWFSSLFWTADEGFTVASLSGFKLYREFANQAYIALGLLALFGVLLGGTGRSLLHIPQRVWFFVVTLYLIGPAILVNGILKAHWGRARPVDTLEFGGDLLFSPPFEIAAQCASNCSFVSGEAAGATAFAISGFILTRFVKAAIWRNALFGLAFAISVSGAFLRIVFGRHFLSDVIFSVLFVSLVAVVLSFFWVRVRGGRRFRLRLAL